MRKKKKEEEVAGALRKMGGVEVRRAGRGEWGTSFSIFGNWHKAHQRMQTTQVGGLQLVVMTGAERK